MNIKALRLTNDEMQEHCNYEYNGDTLCDAQLQKVLDKLIGWLALYPRRHK